MASNTSVTPPQSEAEIQAEISRLEARIAQQTAARTAHTSSASAPSSTSSAPASTRMPLNPAAPPFPAPNYHPPTREYSLNPYPTAYSSPYPIPNNRPPRGSWHSPYRSRGRGRGSYYPRGRGRGGGGPAGAPLPSRHRTLVLNNAAPAAPTTPTLHHASHTNATPGVPTATAMTTSPLASTTQSAPTSQPDNWVKRKTTHNLSLVRSDRYEQTEPARLAALEATAKAKAVSASSRPAKPQRTKPQPSVRRGDKMGEIIIDGVIFEFDESGEKMIKKGPVSSDSPAESTEPASASSPHVLTDQATPSLASFNGQDFVRTKTGNLISKELLAVRRKAAATKAASRKAARLAKLSEGIVTMQRARDAAQRGRVHGRSLVRRESTLCTFFQKTGQCKRGLSCPFIHDENKIAICPGALSAKGCQKPPGVCHLSHTRDQHRVPDCTHFLAGQCRFGADECFYAHSDAAKQTLHEREQAKARGEANEEGLYCREFAKFGWCDQGLTCPHLHSFDCPDFAEKGACTRPGCRLPHVVRAQADAETSIANSTKADRRTVSEFAGVEDDALFLRDDAAAEPVSARRKRSASSSSEAGTESAPQALNLAPLLAHRSKRRKHGAKEFAVQQDFIGLGDEPAEGSESEDEDESDVDTHSEEASDEEDGQDDQDGTEGEDESPVPSSSAPTAREASAPEADVDLS